MNSSLVQEMHTNMYTKSSICDFVLVVRSTTVIFRVDCDIELKFDDTKRPHWNNETTKRGGGGGCKTYI